MDHAYHDGARANDMRSNGTQNADMCRSSISLESIAAHAYARVTGMDKHLVRAVGHLK